MQKNLNVKNKLGLDPLLMSASFSHSDTLRSILRKEGTNIQSTDNERNTALHYAVCNSYSGNSVKTTLNTIISDNSFCEDGALSKNSAFQNTNILIAGGINVNALNKNGHSPLFFAADNKDYNVAKYLLENGADARIADNKNGYTAAYYALKQNDLEMLKFVFTLWFKLY
ncbi:MAG: ankyrin repeat domain-containing protein [Wolbachia endosymbiont of Fragariocoptes setiger]|nr:ankyrin repeat domain-containing protein [Wolbachia endosymbiont of Fragariocoptes setiger]